MINKKLPQYAVFEDSLTNSNNYCFISPIAEIIAYDEISLNESFEKILSLQAKGIYLAGYISYEASYYLNNDLKKLRSKDDGILLHFVAFKNYIRDIPSQSKNSELDVLLDSLSLKEYLKGFSKVKNALENGDSYQVNYTKMLIASTKLTGLELYTKLKALQPVEYAAYLPLAENEVISISPELFFRKNKNKLTVKPMKGTAKLTNNIEKNKEIYNELKNCPKNRSENLIIIDLLRNDLSAICETYSVKVEKAFEIEEYKNILQMTSTISGTVDEKIAFRNIIEKLFPCGSITGAPKNSTMSIIKGIEVGNRSVYTGSIGYILPNNNMCFNVAIRTVQKAGDDLKIGVGGGVTIYSDPYSEWQEMLTKINFIKQAYNPNFKLIETILFYNGFTFLDEHLNRLEETSRRLFFDINIDHMYQQIVDYANSKLESNKKYKVRLEYDYQGELILEHIIINDFNQEKVELIICLEKINSQNKLLRYKTTHDSTRGFYTRMSNKYLDYSNQATELIFINEENNITETRFHNVIVEIDGKKYTPKIEDGVLDGIYRKKLIESKEIFVKTISLEQLKNASAIYIINSVRGVIPAFLRGTK